MSIYHYRASWVISLTVLGVFLFVKCIDPHSRTAINEMAEDSGFARFAGSASCAKCHAAICQSEQLTPHYLTSQLGTDSSIRGPLTGQRNSFYYDPLTRVAAEKRGRGFFQVAYKKGVEKFAKPMDIAVGSAKRGQTFLYWKGNQLFQLPLTYFTATGEWTNSPGFTNKVVFNRPITARCLECHSSYFEKLPSDTSQPEEFSHQHIMLGVNCEKCHGPAALHVRFQTENPGIKTAQYIVNPAKLSREQNLDFCRFCHGGRLKATQPAFSFAIGKKLGDYFSLDSVGTDVTQMDAHGNQYGMLAASKCFRMSQMTCQSCHNPHVNESEQIDAFAAKCKSCHSPDKHNYCKMSGRADSVLINNKCVNCHMPEQTSQAIMVLRQGESVPTSARMRAHFVAVYPDISREVLKEMERKKNGNPKKAS